MKPSSRKETVHAPELDGALGWLNVPRPLSLRELRGCVVVLDFWTYCCINCLHVLPTLREIEHRFRGQPLLVIGVHSGKFSAERDPDRIRDAIGRYGVEHPVVVDEDMSIWSRYAIRSWPTLVVVRPDGTIAAVAPGEPELETLEAFIRGELEAAKERGILAAAPPPLESAPPIPREPLAYPGKAIALPDGRIAISDSGHHRVLVCTADGDVTVTAGGGLRGLRDGAALEAAFDDPQGLCFHDGWLYVADARNHALRRVDLGDGSVTTVAGTGTLGREPVSGRAPATEVALRSPWDLCTVGDTIYVAMAGSHQIWRFFPSAGEIEPYAGTGVEALLDGEVERSAFAQPSGLAARDGVLYVADSETSALRAIDLEHGKVTTLVGQGLFDFGDSEGDAEAALLQHCLGVAADAHGVLVADTYNGKLKRWRGATKGAGDISTVLHGLSEPGSIAVAPDGSWIVADTNAHRVLVVTAGKARPLEVHGAAPSSRGAVDEPPRSLPPLEAPAEWFTTLIDLPEGTGLGLGAGLVSLRLDAPDGTELAAGAPLRASVEVSRRSDLLQLERAKIGVEARGGPSERIIIPVNVVDLDAACIEAEIVAIVDYVACSAIDTARCAPRRLHLRVPVRLLAGGGHGLEVAVDLAAWE
jgi:thiol-disulfide isomerase/thioredoxin